METLALAHSDRIFTYEQIARHGDYAIFQQTHKESGIARFEVIRIRVRSAHTWPNGRTTPAHEAYPSAESWGRDAWTFHSRDEAEKAYAALCQGDKPC